MPEKNNHIKYISPSVKGFSVYVKEYDTSAVVYDGRSGDIHRVNPLCGLLLPLLIDQPMTIQDLTSILIDQYEIDAKPDRVQDEVLASLRYLQSLELVETI